MAGVRAAARLPTPVNALVDRASGGLLRGPHQARASYVLRPIGAMSCLLGEPGREFDAGSDAELGVDP